MANLMELTLGLRYNNNVQCVNRFNYITSGTPAAVSRSLALAHAFSNGFDPIANLDSNYPLEVLMGMLSSAVTVVDIAVKDVYSETDFYQTPLLVPCQTSGDVLPPFAAFGFRTNRTRLDVRRGTKRFPGVPEANQDKGVFVAGAIANMNKMASRLGATLSYSDEGQPITFTPVVCGKQKYDVPDSGTPPREAYRYYPTYDLQAQHMMTSILWEPYDTVRSQTSRQFGRGM